MAGGYTTEAVDERVRQLQQKLDAALEANADLEGQRDGALVQAREAEARLEKLNAWVRNNPTPPQPGAPGSEVERVFYAGRSGDFVGPDGVSSAHYEAGDPIPHGESIPHLQTWLDSGHIVARHRAVVPHPDPEERAKGRTARSKADPHNGPASGGPAADAGRAALGVDVSGEPGASAEG